MSAAALQEISHALRKHALDHFEVFVHQSREQILRYANNRVTQATQRQDETAHIQLWAHGGRATLTLHGKPGGAFNREIEAAIGRARAMAMSGAKDEPAVLVAPTSEPQTPAFPATDEAILHALEDTGSVAKGLPDFFARAEADQAELAGRMDLGWRRTMMANSLGLERTFSSTRAEAQTIAVDVHSDYISGYASHIGTHRASLDLAALADRSVRKCVRSRNHVDLPPGSYDVILEPEAVSELLSWLAMVGLTGRSLEEKMSFMTDRMNEQIVGPEVTLVDDGLCSHGLGIPEVFDMEGTPKTKLVLIEKGIARSVVWDGQTAQRSGCRSTGHASCSVVGPSREPHPRHLWFHGGQDSPEGLIERVDRGLWVTRFHYVNGMLDPPRAVMTGLTRDGTFLIENGKLGPGVGMLRFTDSILEALKRVDGLSRKLEAVRAGWGDPSTYVAPTILLRGLNFTGNASG